MTASLIALLADFVESIGIPARAACSREPTLFPGLDIKHGSVLIDEATVIHPGDILHEAGHIAVSEPSIRNAARLDPSGGEELSALAWSYAAALHLGLHPSVVLYPSSYHDQGDILIEAFADRRYIGVPLLARFGMTWEPKRAPADVAPYPHMLRWLR